MISIFLLLLSNSMCIMSDKFETTQMAKKIITVDMKKVNEKMLRLLSELQSKGYTKDGYLVYDESDKEDVYNIYSKYGVVFLE